MDGRMAATPGQETKMWPNVTRWPDKMDFQSKPFEDPATPDQGLNWSFETDGNWVWHGVMRYDATGSCGLLVEIAEGAESQKADCKVLMDQPNKFAIWAQDGRLRFYLKRSAADGHQPADGFGDSKPAARNDTPQGRAENRRVEFVKI